MSDNEMREKFNELVIKIKELTKDSERYIGAFEYKKAMVELTKLLND